MKIILREWYKNKQALSMLVIWFVANCIYLVVDMNITRMISFCFENPVQRNFLILIAMLIAGVVLTAMTRYFRGRANNTCFIKLNNQYGDKLLFSDYQIFTKYSVAHIMTYNEFNQKITSTMFLFTEIILFVFSMCVTLFGIWSISPGVIPPIVLLYIIGLSALNIINKQFYKVSAEFDKARTERNQNMENIINGFSEIRAFGMQVPMSCKLHRSNMKVMDTLKRSVMLLTEFHTSVELISNLGLMIIIAYGVHQIQIGNLTTAAAMSLALYIVKLINPVANIGDYIAEFNEMIAMSKNYGEILDYQNQMKKGYICKEDFQDKISVNHVNFKYAEDSELVLEDLNFEVKKGQKIGICGESGMGKSTIFKLLHHFYDPQGGSITIDGVDIRNIAPIPFSNLVGSVQQENVIFPGSIYENVKWVKPKATYEEIVEACKKASIYNFIMSLPNQFETEVGPRGLKLSGGQKQRISLARLFLKDPQIILLDEATSALDNETETFIQDAIASLSGKTIITIAHRLSTIRNSDKIFVIGKKGIVESGTHEELMNLHGVYYAMNK